MDSLEEGAVHQATPQGTIEQGAQTSEEVQVASDRPQTNDRPTQDRRANSEPL